MNYVATIHFKTDHPDIASSEDFDFFALQADVGNVEVTDIHVEPIDDSSEPKPKLCERCHKQPPTDKYYDNSITEEGWYCEDCVVDAEMEL